MSQFHEYIKIAKEMIFEEEEKETSEESEDESEETDDETSEETESDETSEQNETESNETSKEEVKTISIEKIQKDFEGQTEINAEEFFKKYKSIFIPIVKKLSKKGK